MSFENPYMILTMPAHKDCIDLECDVNGYIHIGWQPQCGPFYVQHQDGPMLAQAMVYVGTPEEKNRRFIQ